MFRLWRIALSDPNVVQQVGKQSAYGIEVAAGLRLTSYLSLNANAALLNARFDDFTEVSGGVPVSRNGNQPPNVPELTANLGPCSLQPPPGASVEVCAMSGSAMPTMPTPSASRRIPFSMLLSFCASAIVEPVVAWPQSDGCHLRHFALRSDPVHSGGARVIELVANLRF